MFIRLKEAPNKPTAPVIDAGVRHAKRRIFRLRDLVSRIVAAICTGAVESSPPPNSHQSKEVINTRRIVTNKGCFCTARS